MQEKANMVIKEAGLSADRLRGLKQEAHERKRWLENDCLPHQTVADLIRIFDAMIKSGGGDET